MQQRSLGSSLAMSTRLVVAARGFSRMTSNSPKAHADRDDHGMRSSYGDRDSGNFDRLREGFGDLGRSVVDDDAESFERSGLMFARMRESLGLPTQTGAPDRGSPDNVKLTYWIDDDAVPPLKSEPADFRPESEPPATADYRPELEELAPADHPPGSQSPAPADYQPELEQLAPANHPPGSESPAPAEYVSHLPDPPEPPIPAALEARPPLRRDPRADRLRAPRQTRLGRSPLVERALGKGRDAHLRAPIRDPEPEGPASHGTPPVEPPTPKFVIGDRVAQIGQAPIGRGPDQDAPTHADVPGSRACADQTGYRTDAAPALPPLHRDQAVAEPARSSSRLTFISGFLLGAILIGAYFIITGDDSAQQPPPAQEQNSSQIEIEPAADPDAQRPDHSWLTEAAESAGWVPPVSPAAIEPAAPAPRSGRQLRPDRPLGPTLIAQITTRARFHPQRYLVGLTFERTSPRGVRRQPNRLDWSLVTGRRRTRSLPPYLENDAERLEAIRPVFQYTVFFRR